MPRSRNWAWRPVLVLLMVLGVAPSASRGLFAAPAPQVAPELQPETPADVRIRDAYREQMLALRNAMLVQCEQILASKRANQKEVSSANTAKNEELKQDIEKCRSSSTCIPALREFSKPAATYEAEAAKARVACRTKIKKLASDAKAKENMDESDRLISELDAYCPPTVSPTQFKARLAKLGEEFKSPKVKDHSAHEHTIEVRDRLSKLLISAGEAQISAEDLTPEIKSLLAFIQDSVPLRKNGNKKEHKEMLLNTAAALKALLDEAAAR